jgi:hypothetical protein
VKYAAIADWAADEEYPVTFMCDQLEVASVACRKSVYGLACGTMSCVGCCPAGAA